LTLPETWLSRHRRAVLSGATLVFVLGVIFGTRVGFELDLMKVLPRGEPAVSSYIEVLQLFRSLDLVLLDVHSPQAPYDPAVVRVAEHISTKLPASPLIHSVKGRVGLDDLASGYELLTSHRASLFSEKMAAATDLLLEQRSIEERLDDIRRQLVSFPDPVTARMFRTDPLGLNQLLIGLIPSPNADAEGAHMVDGWLWSADGKHLLLAAEPTTTDLDSALSDELVAQVERTVLEARAEEDAEHVEVAHLSRFRAAQDNERMIKSDIGRTLWLSLAGIVLVLLLSFGADRRALLVFIPAVFGGAVAMGMLALVYGRVSPMVVGCGSILLGISVDYGIHVIFLASHTPGGNQEVLRETARPIFLASMTTSIALMSLLTSALPGHQQLGVFAASGVVAAAACSLVVLPLLLPSAGPITGGKSGATISLWVARMLTVLRRQRWLVGAAVVVLSIVAAFGALRLNVESDLSRYNAMSDAALSDRRMITEVWGSPIGKTSVVLKGSTLNDALTATEKLLHWLDALPDQVDTGQSIVALMPSRQTQQANRARWADYWNAERLHDVRQRFERAAELRGFRPATLTEFWSSVSAGTTALTFNDLQATPLGRVLQGYVSLGRGEARVLTQFKISEHASFETLSAQLRSVFPTAVAANGPQMMQRLADLTYSELRKMSLLSFALVMAFLLSFSRSVRQPLVLVVVLGVTFLWALGAYGWFGVPITMMNSLIAIFIFGLTVDYSIFLLHAASSTSPHSHVIGSAVLVSSATTILGFGALMLARHPSLSSIGETTVIGVACGLAASFVIVPILTPRT